MPSLRGESTVTAGDRTLRLVMTNQAWMNVEDVLDESYLDVLEYLGRCIAEGRNPKMRTLRALLWAACGEHHPDVSLDDAATLLMAHPTIYGGLGEAMRGSLSLAKDDEPGEAMPPATAASPDGTGTKS